MAFSFFGSRKTSTTPPTPPPPPPVSSSDQDEQTSSISNMPIMPLSDEAEVTTPPTPPSISSDNEVQDVNDSSQDTQTVVVTAPDLNQQVSMKDIHAPAQAGSTGSTQIAAVQAELVKPEQDTPIPSEEAETLVESSPNDTEVTATEAALDQIDDKPFILDVEDIMDESGPVKDLEEIDSNTLDENSSEPEPEVEVEAKPEPEAPLASQEEVPQVVPLTPVEDATFSDEFKQEIKELFDSETGKEGAAITAEESRLNQEQQMISEEEEEINRRLESIKRHQEELQKRKDDLASNQAALAARKAKAEKVLEEL